MKYPLYTNEDLKWVERDGTYELSDFAGFISELVQQELLNHEAEIGVAKFVESNGTQDLSEKQAKVLEIIVDKYADEKCKRCGLKISISEVIESMDNGGFCDYCAQQMSRDKD